MDQSLRLPRHEVRQFDCPECGAVGGENCVGVRGKIRTSNHAKRVKVAFGMLGCAHGGHDFTPWRSVSIWEIRECNICGDIEHQVRDD